MVLNDAALLERFDRSVALSLGAVKRLESTPEEALGGLPDAWRQAIEQLSQGLHRSTPRAELVPFLTRLAEVNSELGHNGRRWICLLYTSRCV